MPVALKEGKKQVLSGGGRGRGIVLIKRCPQPKNKKWSKYFNTKKDFTK